MQGGPSQVDTYDPKPLLAKLNGQHPPASFGRLIERAPSPSSTRVRRDA